MSESPATKRVFWSRVKSAIFGVLAIALFAWVIYRNGGVDTVTSIISRVGMAWPLLLIPYGVTALFTLLGYRVSLPRGGKDIPLFVLTRIERSGSALTAVLPMGESSANVIKLALLRHWYRTDEIVTAGAWGALGTGVSNAFACIGPFVAVALGVVDAKTGILIGVVSIVMAIPACVTLYLAKYGLAERFAAWVVRIPVGYVRKRSEKITVWSQRVDINLVAAVGERRRDFIMLVVYRVVRDLCRVAQVWLVIELLGLPGGFLAALIFNALSRAVAVAAGVIPGRLGIQELTAGAVFASLGFPPDYGVQIALAMRFLYFVNLILASLAFSSTHELMQKYPPRSDEERARSAAGEASVTNPAMTERTAS